MTDKNRSDGEWSRLSEADCARLPLRLLAIVGPTASGKSALAVEVAKRLGGEIVSCDSMQIYRRMSIGTAKPTEAEMDGIPHYMIDTVEPDEPFNCADYVKEASRAIAEIAARGHLPIVCGGTGLYLDSLLRGSFEETQSDPALRESLFAYAEAHGNHALHERLRAVDPESAEAIHENNVKRVVRALEIYESTGMTKSEADKRTQEGASPYHATVFGLFYEDRAVLYDRIERRVDEMMKNGLLEEMRALQKEGVFEKNGTAAQAIGYKELMAVTASGEGLDEAIRQLKCATRRYAKRQLTWFSAKEYVHRVEVLQNGSVRSVTDAAEEICKRFFDERA